MKSLIDLQKMKKGDYREMNDAELVESIHRQLEIMQSTQRYLMSEQEQTNIKLMNTEELLKLLIENQTITSNKIDTLLERWD